MADCFINKSEPKAKAAAEAPKSEAEAAIIASGKYTVEIPRTWKEVTCYVNDGSCKALSNLDRSAAQFLEYDAFREKVSLAFLLVALRGCAKQDDTIHEAK